MKNISTKVVGNYRVWAEINQAKRTRSRNELIALSLMIVVVIIFASAMGLTDLEGIK